MMDSQEVTQLVAQLLQQNNQFLLGQLNEKIQQFSLAAKNPNPQSGQLPAADADPGQSEMEVESEADDEYDDDENFKDGRDAWQEVLPSNKVIVTGRPLGLLARLKHPPPLSLVTNVIRDSVAVEGLPEAPPPRRVAGDRALYLTQKKMEFIMTELVFLTQKSDSALDPKIAQVAAMARSSWQDLQDGRRRLLAGKQAFKLDKRPDLEQNRLLSDAEESKLKQTAKSKGKGSFRPFLSQHYADRALSSHGGKRRQVDGKR
jgi:hypothetical protein